MSDLVSH